MNSFYGSNDSLKNEMEVGEASSSGPLTVIHDSKAGQKILTAPDSSDYLKMRNKILTDPVFSSSNVMRPTLQLSSKSDSHRDDSLTSQISTEKLPFISQLTLL